MPKRTKPLFWKSIAPWPAPKNRPDHWVSWSVMEDEWKLVANRDLDHVELFRISEDWREANNLADEQPDRVESLLGKIRAWQETLPDAPSGNVFSAEREEL